MYLEEQEFLDLGFSPVDEFDTLRMRAEHLIDTYVDNYYTTTSFDEDYDIRTDAVKLALAYQIDYMNQTGSLSAEDTTNIKSVSIGRTRVEYADVSHGATNSGLSTDAQTILVSVCFGYRGVSYDR